jgi:hypothetical protein
MPKENRTYPAGSNRTNSARPITLRRPKVNAQRIPHISKPGAKCSRMPDLSMRVTAVPVSTTAATPTTS